MGSPRKHAAELFVRISALYYGKKPTPPTHDGVDPAASFGGLKPAGN
jgi:hypothetical protein